MTSRPHARSLESDPSCVGEEGGPFGWVPLLYTAYGRVGDRPLGPSAVEVARLLLERGADPNDSQALYNEAPNTYDDWIELLLEFGLGTGDGGPWRRLLAPALESPRDMLEDALKAAAGNGFTHRVGVLLDHGADPSGYGTRHRVYHGRSPLEEAALHGHPEIVDMLERAGASNELDSTDILLCSATAGDMQIIRLLVEYGADVDVRDSGYDATPGGWAEHFEQAEAHAYLRAREGPR